MLLIAEQCLKMNAWKPWKELITQSYYLLLKPNLKIVQVQNAVILSKMIFLPAKSHMHIFNMLITFVHSFKLIAWKLWEELITQTCYPILKPNLKKLATQYWSLTWRNCLSPKHSNSVENYFLLAKSHMHIFNILITSVKSFKLITWKLWEELITQTCYPILKPNLKIV